jgi:nucleoside-diphosphate-sugar epimerase
LKNRSIILPEHILVTGAAGYLGSTLCAHLLRENYRVTALDNLMYGEQCLFHLAANRDFDFIKGDVRDRKLMTSLLRGVDAIVPLAAIVGAGPCDRDPLMTQSVNVDAVKLLNELRSDSQLVLYPTTNSGYGSQSGEEFCTEDTPLEPISLYGKTKVEAEQLFLDSQSAITLRLATVYGLSPRMRIDLLVNHFTLAALTDGYIVLFEAHFKRNYIHVRDVADCFLHCLKNRDAMLGRAFNLGLDSANMSKLELAQTIKKYVPDFFIHEAEIGVDPDKRNYIVSNQRLREAGFEASRSLDDGIQELIKGYRMLGRARFKNI